MKRQPAATTTTDLRATARARLDARLRAAASEPGSRALDAGTKDRLLARVLASAEKYLVAPARADGEGTSSAEVESFVDRLRLAELLLVVRCEAGDEAAWRELVAEFTPTVRGAARRACGASGGDADELAASVWTELYGATGHKADDAADHTERKGKLAYYSGCGSLGGWLRAVVAQLAIDRHRRARRFVQLEDSDAPHDETAAVNLKQKRETALRLSPPTPEETTIERQADELLARTLRRAVAELPAADRLLLRLYYIDDLRLREAGAALGCSEATASRRLNQVHARLRERTTAILRAEANLGADQIAELFAAAARPGADVRRWLAPEAAADAD